MVLKFSKYDNAGLGEVQFAVFVLFDNGDAHGKDCLGNAACTTQSKVCLFVD